MNGAELLPITLAAEWFSSTTITICAGVGMDWATATGSGDRHADTNAAGAATESQRLMTAV